MHFLKKTSSNLKMILFKSMIPIHSKVCRTLSVMEYLTNDLYFYCQLPKAMLSKASILCLKDCEFNNVLVERYFYLVNIAIIFVNGD